MKLRHPLTAVLLVLSSLTVHAITVTEPPDQANAGLGTAYVLEPGQNTISGTVSTPSDAQDRFQVSVPEGMFLVAVSATTGGASLNGSVLFNNAPVNGLAAPLGFGTYAVFISTSFSVGTNWSFSFTVENPGVVIGVDTFDYPDGPLAGQAGGTFWDYKNVSPTGRTNVKSNWDNLTGGPASISGGRLQTSGNGWVKREYNGADESQGAVNEFNVAKTVFYRVTVTTGATLPDYFGFASYDFGTERLFLGKRSGSSTFGYEIVGGANANSAIAVPVNATFTLVMRLDFATNGISLFLNPNLRLPFDHPSNVVPGVVVANAFYNGTNWSTALRLASGTSTGTPVFWDNLVVATTWEALADPQVTTAVDEDNGFLGGGTGVSLREAVKYGVTGPITFDPSLSGKTITLTHPDGDMLIPSSVTIDATALPGGLTVDANKVTRHFQVLLGKSLTLLGLTLTGGFSDYGGAIANTGAVALTQCTLTGNSSSGEGGAISNFGTLTLTHCTFSGNSASLGGAIDDNLGILSLNHCTLSGNRANAGGALSFDESSLTLHNTIIAGNAAPAGQDLRDFGFFNSTITGVNLIGSLAGSTLTAGPTVRVGDPKLSPLGYFGGPVQTMHPLIGSPAIDAAGSTDPGGTDARGFLRFVNGDNLGGSQLDIGAVEAGRLLTVAIAGDAPNVNNLRGLIAAAPLFTPSLGKGTRIGFSPGISPITLTLGELMPVAGNSLFFDASNIPGGVTISGGGNSRVFNIPATTTVAMHSVRIVGGKAADGPSPATFGNGGNGDNAGGILNAGSLSLFYCSVQNNRSGNGGTGGVGGNGGNGGGGGGIFSTGSLSLTACTFSGNGSGTGGGGGLNGSGGNGAGGGGIFSTGSLSLTACTLASNASGNGGNGGAFGTGGNGGSGGGINAASVILQHCLIARNTQGSSTTLDEVRATTLTYLGINLLGTPAIVTGTVTGSLTVVSPDPRLAPLSDYGGPTFTMLPLPGSPAIDFTTGNTRTTDQRGFPMNGTPDLGAVEVQAALVGTVDTDSDGMDDRLEIQYGFIVGVNDGNLDTDGDGSRNKDELGNKTGPRDSASLLKILTLSRTGNNVNVTWTSFPGLSYTVESGPTLSFGLVSSPIPATGMTTTLNDGGYSNPKHFFRVRRN